MWTSLDMLTRYLERVQADPLGSDATHIFLIFCHDADDSAFERSIFRTKTYVDYVQARQIAQVKGIRGAYRSSFDRDAVTKLHKQYGVETWPTIIVMGGNGKELARPAISAGQPEALVKALEKCVQQNAANFEQARQAEIRRIREARPPRTPGRPFR